MTSIRNSGLFTVIVLLACLLCVPYAIAAVLTTVAAVVSIVAGVVGIVVILIRLTRWILGEIGDIRDTLGNLKDQKTQVEDQLGENSGEEKELTKRINRYEDLLEQSEEELETATQENEAAKAAYDAAKKDVEDKEKIYDEISEEYADHVDGCVYCRVLMQPCSYDTQLSGEVSNALSDLREARVSRTFARSEYHSTKSEKARWNRYVSKYSSKLSNYRDDHSDLLEGSRRLINKKADLDTQIGEREIELRNAQDYLRKLQSAKSYAKSIKAARDAGEDMEFWVRENPPPQEFLDYLNGDLNLE